MNYTELKANVNDICEQTFTDDQLAMFTKQAEQKIYTTVSLPALRKNQTGSLTSNNKYLTEKDLGSVLDEKETAIEAQKEPVIIESDDQSLTKINKERISEAHNSSDIETVVEQVSTPKIATLKEIEMEAIKSSVERNKWNMTTTAEELGISRMTLYRKLDQYGLRSKEQ